MKRIYGVDLLRIISMFGIVMLHFNGASGVMSSVEKGTANFYISWIIEILTFCSVDVFALISGYVGVDAKWKFTNYIMLWLTVEWYNIIIYGVHYLFIRNAIDYVTVADLVLPVMTDKYWYFTAYTMVFMFMPIINSFFKSDLKRHHEIIIVGLIILYVLIPFIKTDLYYLAGGYSGLWLLVLYCIGAYLRKSTIIERVSNKFLVSVYIISFLFTLVICFSQSHLVTVEKILKYNSPTILAQAVALLLIFSKINSYLLHGNVPKIIDMLSPLCFGVYLIHSHKVLFGYWFLEKWRFVGKLNPIKMVLYEIIITIVVFICCLLIDRIRKMIFDRLKIKDKIEYFMQLSR